MRTALTRNLNWNDVEIAAIVRDYFDMLADELNGRPYVKTEHRRALMAELDGRSEGSIEMKHCNISAVLEAMSLPYIDGYKPRKNIQDALRGAVAAHIQRMRFFERNRKGRRPA